MLEIGESYHRQFIQTTFILVKLVIVMSPHVIEFPLTGQNSCERRFSAVSAVNGIPSTLLLKATASTSHDAEALLDCATMQIGLGTEEEREAEKTTSLGLFVFALLAA